MVLHGQQVPGRDSRRAPVRRRRGLPVPHRAHERGAFAILAVPLLLLIIALCGFALDLGRVYNRKAELQGIAKQAAFAAVRELDGTAAGIAAAKVRAAAVAEGLVYDYRVPVRWDDRALQFSTGPERSGEWSDGTGTGAPLERLYFARVDTDGLDAEIGTVQTVFMRLLSRSLSSVHVRHSVVAGRTSVDVTPLAVCAMERSQAMARGDLASGEAELVEFGYRRGVVYDLMALSPTSLVPQRFRVDPVGGPGNLGMGAVPAGIAPFVCSGSMWVTHLLTGGNVRVAPLPASAPLAGIQGMLNTRFGDYGAGLCSTTGAPVDRNIKPYAYDQPGGVSWMVPATGSRSAATTTVRGRLETIADLPDPSGVMPGQYGPLWSYARPVKYNAYTDAGGVEPPGGYTPFPTSAWPRLYPAGPKGAKTPLSPVASGYPSGSGATTPYWELSGPNVVLPDKGVDYPERRVLRLPLLQCPVPAGGATSARVLAIGKFFMTVPATDDALLAEFAGVAPEASLRGEVTLFP